MILFAAERIALCTFLKEEIWRVSVQICSHANDYFPLLYIYVNYPISCSKHNEDSERGC